MSRVPLNANTGPSALLTNDARDQGSSVRDGHSTDIAKTYCDAPATGNGRGNPKPPVGREAVAAQKPFNRSRVTNGKDLLPGIDGRSAWARRYRDLINGLIADLGEPLTEAERQQVRTAAALQLHVEQITAAMVNGQAVDSEAITRAGNGAIRALSAVKRRRAARKSPGGGLASYLAKRTGETPS